MTGDRLVEANSGSACCFLALSGRRVRDHGRHWASHALRARSALTRLQALVRWCRHERRGTGRHSRGALEFCDRIVPPNRCLKLDRRLRSRTNDRRVQAHTRHTKKPNRIRCLPIRRSMVLARAIYVFCDVRIFSPDAQEVDRLLHFSSPRRPRCLRRRHNLRPRLWALRLDSQATRMPCFHNAYRRRPATSHEISIA